MKISATAPMSKAADHMVRVCFRPFSLDKWLALGFCAFLAGLLDGGGASFNIPSWPGGDSEWGEQGEALEALEELFGVGGEAPLDQAPSTIEEAEPGDGTSTETWDAERGADAEPGESWDTSGDAAKDPGDELDQEFAKELGQELEDDDFASIIEQAPAWIQDHLSLMITIAVIAGAIGLILALVLLWLSSRGEFMFIDGVVKDRGAVVEPWGRLRPQANSLLRARLLLGLLFGGAVLLLLAIAAVDVMPKVMERQFEEIAVGQLAAMGALILFTALFSVLVSAVLHNLVVPIMYVRECGALEAWRLCRQELLPGNGGAVFVFFLLKIVFFMGAGVVTGILVLVTCCLAALPYVGTVLLLPVLVFLRGFSLFFVDQLGAEFRMFEDGAVADDPGATPYGETL